MNNNRKQANAANGKDKINGKQQNLSNYKYLENKRQKNITQKNSNSSEFK